MGGGWTGCVCQGMAGGIGNGETLGIDVAAGAHGPGFTAGTKCTGGANCAAGAAGCMIGGLDDAGVLPILAEAGALDMLETCKGDKSRINPDLLMEHLKPIATAVEQVCNEAVRTFDRAKCE